MRRPRVLEVEREVRIGEVRPLLHDQEVLAGEDVRNSEADVDVAVQFVPGVEVGFVADVVAGGPCGIADDGTARGVVERIGRAG